MNRSTLWTLGRSPEIWRPHGRVPVVEGVMTGLSREDDLTLSYAVDNYAFLVPPGVNMTGGHWVAAISQTFDRRTPIVAEVLDVIERAMLVDRFRDEEVIFDRGGFGVFRGRGPRLEAAWSAMEGEGATRQVASRSTHAALSQARIAMAKTVIAQWGGRVSWNGTGVSEQAAVRGVAIYRDHFLDLNDNSEVIVPGPGMLSEMLELLRHRSVGRETFTPKQGDNETAQLNLMAALSNHLGYSALATARPTNYSPGQQAAGAVRDSDADLDASQVSASLQSFIGGMVDAGWDTDKDVYLTRLAPTHVFRARPFEAGIGHGLIGWRLPRALVQKCVARHLEQDAEERPRAQQRQAA